MKRFGGFVAILVALPTMLSPNVNRIVVALPLRLGLRIARAPTEGIDALSYTQSGRRTSQDREADHGQDEDGWDSDAHGGNRGQRVVTLPSGVYSIARKHVIIFRRG